MMQHCTNRTTKVAKIKSPADWADTDMSKGCMEACTCAMNGGVGGSGDRMSDGEEGKKRSRRQGVTLKRGLGSLVETATTSRGPGGQVHGRRLTLGVWSELAACREDGGFRVKISNVINQRL
mmetsp:Transcript_13548/g.20619  ORF Transcript_13548/g.20619 Transcript_13548/m.20619 type:complete len:122 (-) Transcript_13548:151-516(-)